MYVVFEIIFFKVNILAHPMQYFCNCLDSKCPMCNKMIPAEDVEVHFVMCLTKPRVTYNGKLYYGNIDCF